ncbi:MAG: cache domain-containing protein [Deltaproteobacteria bacterium]|nr:cache domain-containing protein [Deltaproteobacteria bacterium]
MEAQRLKEMRDRRFGFALLRLVRRMPLRTRLVLAFVILILSSASATIAIGNSVFGGKVDELARDVVTLYSKLASQVLDARLERMRLVVKDVASRRADGADALALCRMAITEVPADFLVVRGADGATVLMTVARDGAADAPRCATMEAGGTASVSPPRDLLPAQGGQSEKDNSAKAGIAVLDAVAARSLGLTQQDGGSMTAVAGAPINGSGFALLGYVLNGRVDILSQAQQLVPTQRKERLMATLFLGDRRIASTKPEAVGTRADAGVAETVIGKGMPFAGVARVIDENFYAAYVPIRDLGGSIVGMMGIGTNEDAYAEVRHRTTTLFSSLIAGGMIFGFIMTFLFSMWLVSPVGQLAEGMSRVAEGDLNYKVRIESADELGKLARAFNQMVRAVKERDHRLREMTESRLSAVEKQISVGRLAAGVAHEINNPLTAILSLSSLWLKKMPETDPRREDLEIIVTETSRCREIVRNLLDFARERPTEKQVVDINKVVRDTLVLANKYDSMENVAIETDLSPLPLRVNADPKLLQQVLTNLLLNGAEAAGRGGSVRIATDEDSSGGFVQVQVADRGKGIPKEHINRVFEPFFTTKGTGKGTGLGLSVSLGIVQRHDGTIEIESEDGRGTTVTVVLPRVTEVQS